MAIENKENRNNDIASVLVISVLFSTVAIVASTYYFINKQSEQIQSKVEKSIEKVEIMKVGGEKNYELLKKLYSNKAFVEQQGKQLETAIQQFGQEQGDNTGNSNSSANSSTSKAPNDNGEQFKTGKLTKEQLDTITKDAYVKGSKDANIIWLEYSDLECPFCKRHHINNTIETVMKNHEGKIKYIFKHYPLNFHPLAQKGAESIECVGELGGEEKLYDFLDKSFKIDEASVDNLTKIVEELGLSKDKFKQCLDSGKYADLTQSQMKQGLEMFNVTGTPGNVLINTDTLEYVVIAGAYPAEAFETELAKIMK